MAPPTYLKRALAIKQKLSHNTSEKNFTTQKVRVGFQFFIEMTARRSKNTRMGIIVLETFLRYNNHSSEMCAAYNSEFMVGTFIQE